MYQNILDIIYISELVFSIFFISTLTLLSPSTHKILRNSKVFNGLIILTLIIAISSLFLLSINDQYTQVEKINSFISLSPITFLILYRIFNEIIKKKYNRPLYFSKRYNYISPDPESGKQTWLEFGFQIILFSVLFFWGAIGYSLCTQTNFIKNTSNIANKNNYNFNVEITLKTNEKDSSGLINITKNNSPFRIIESNGIKYPMVLDFNANYLFKFSKRGYSTKIVYFNTNIPVGRERKEFAKFTVDVELFKTIKGEKDPIKNVGGVKYDPTMEDFEKVKIDTN